MLKLKKIVTVVFILIINFAVAQNIPNEVKLKIQENPSKTGKIYFDYAKQYEKAGKYEESIACYKKINELYKQTNNNQGIAFSNNKIGNIYSKMGNFSKAMPYYKKAFNIYSSLNKTKEAYSAAENIGYNYFQLKKYEKAIEYYSKAYNLIKNTNDNKKQAYILNKIAKSYNNYGNYEVALKYFNKALATADTVNMKELTENIKKGIESTENNLKNKQKHITKYDIEKEEEKQQFVENLQKQYNNIKTKHLLSLKEINKLSYENQAKELKLHVIKEKYEKQLLENQLKEQKIKLLKSENELKEKRVKLLETENKLKELKINTQHKIILIISISLAVVIILLIIIIRLLTQRTKTLKLLKEKNHLIDEKNQELNQQNEEIAAQRDELERQRDMLNQQNKEITSSIKYAKRIQTSILPAHSLIEKEIKDFFIMFKPKNIVSGDFYWFVKKGDIAWGAVVDCTGHGVPGAFMSMIGNSLLNKIVLEQNVEKPALVLEKLNKELNYALNQNKDDETSDDGMDMTICKINLKTGEVTLALANHAAILVNPGKTPEIIEGDIFSIGGMFADMDNIKFTDINIKITKGTAIYMFSDGFQDQFGGSENKKYTREKMVEKIKEISSKSMREQEELFEQEFDDWKGINEQIDDVLLVGVKF